MVSLSYFALPSPRWMKGYSFDEEHVIKRNVFELAGPLNDPKLRKMDLSETLKSKSFSDSCIKMLCIHREKTDLHGFIDQDDAEKESDSVLISLHVLFGPSLVYDRYCVARVHSVSGFLKVTVSSLS